MLIVKIRSATPSDLDSIVEVFRSCWNISYSGLLPQKVQEEMTIAAAKDMWSAAVNPHHNRTTILADTNKKVAGMARFGIDPDNEELGHLFSLYVHPESSGQGIGRALLLESIKRLNNDGFVSLSLWVFRDNDIAKKLYSSEGFSPNGEVRIDPRWQIPEMKMVL